MANGQQQQTQRFVRLDVNEISVVDDGANEEENFLTTKRKQKGIETMPDFLDTIFGEEGKDAGSKGTDKAGDTLTKDQLLETLKRLNGKVDALAAKFTDKAKGDGDDAGDATGADDSKDTDKAKRVTRTRLDQLKTALASIQSLVEDIEGTPQAAAKAETDKLREEFTAMLAPVAKAIETLTALVAKGTAGDDAGDAAAKDKPADKADDGKTKDKPADKAGEGDAAAGADDGKTKDTDKAGDKAGDTKATDKGGSNAEPDDGDDGSSKKTDKAADPFRGMFAGTALGRSIEKHRTGGA